VWLTGCGLSDERAMKDERNETTEGERSKMRSIRLTFLTFLLFLMTVPAQGARIKDIAGIGGVRDNQLVGYGLVAGLAGTGDDVKNGFTKETIVNMLIRQGISMTGRDLKADNVAAVMVTAKLPPFAKIGTK